MPPREVSPLNNTQQIINILRTAGLEAFLPGVNEGVCRSPYCVVRVTSSSTVSPAGGYVRYRVHLYVPADRPELLDDLAEAVRAALVPAVEQGRLLLSVPRGDTGVDDTYRAACSYTEYVSYYSQR